MKIPTPAASATKKPDVVQTTLEIPRPVWFAIKVRAAHERSNLRAICLRAIDAYLATPLGDEAQ